MDSMFFPDSSSRASLQRTASSATCPARAPPALPTCSCPLPPKCCPSRRGQGLRNWTPPAFPKVQPSLFPALHPREKALSVLISQNLCILYCGMCSFRYSFYHVTSSVLCLTCRYLSNKILFSFIYLLGILLF